jgi:hypothetical protein
MRALSGIVATVAKATYRRKSFGRFPQIPKQATGIEAISRDQQSGSPGKR